MNEALPEDLRVLVRGWMHGNVVVLRGAVPALIDTGYHTGVDDVRAAFLDHTGAAPSEAPGLIALTHTHSDHGGGVASLQEDCPVTVLAHVDTQRMVNSWDTDAMWLDSTGQQMPRYRVDDALHHGDSVRLGDRTWSVIETPGHATGGVSYLDAIDGILVTGDALWRDGFGILNPWRDGEHVFADAERALQNLSETNARVIIPGHGPPFGGLDAAIERARSRLAHLEQNRDRLQVLVVRSCAGFLQLARPDLSRTAIRQITESMARSLALPDDRVATCLDEVLGR